MTTPPPQGQNPFAQGQQPYGQPQAPYPPQGGYPQQPGQPGFPQQGPAPYAPVPPQRPKRSARQKLRTVAAIVGAIVIVGGWYFNHEDDAKKLAVGDCLTNKGSNDNPDIKQLDCSDPKADYKVLKKDNGTSLAMLACQGVSGTTAAVTWKEGSDSFVLCLGKNK
ncbi:LppU/SCO3897 family protein [Streptomyces sp. NPDC001709]